MSLIRVLRTAASTLTRTVYVDGIPVDPTGTPTVTVKRLDGTSVASGNATIVGGDTGMLTFVLPGGPSAPASATWQLDVLVVSWTASVGGAQVTMTDWVEVVGGFLFNLADARAEPTIADPVRYPTALLASRRIEVEDECELICGQAFVPRFTRRLLNGTGTDTICVPDPFIRTVRAVSIGGATGAARTALSDLTQVVPTDAGILVRAGGNVWPKGISTVLIEYEHGRDFPPARISTAAKTRLRTLLTAAKTSGVPANVRSYSTQEGTVYQLATSGPKETGIPEVDAVYRKYPSPIPDFA